VLNELAQWAVLLFIAVFVVGLTRHLGQFLVSQREQLADEYGPGVGSRLSRDLFSRSELDELQALVEQAPGKWGLVAVINEMCEACDTWLDEFAERKTPMGLPLAFLTGRSGSERLDRLAELADLVVIDHDGERIRDANLRATPFLMVVDADLRIHYQQVGGGVHAGVARWMGRLSEQPEQPVLSVSGANT
jgi:hypothetical protein